MQIIAEIGINYAHGNNKENFINNAKRLIDIASIGGCTHVKLQKRDPDTSTPESQKNKPKKVPWRKEEITYLQYKKDIEFSIIELNDLFTYARSKNLIPFVSVWDVKSAEDVLPLSCLIKIPSAHLTNDRLLKFCNKLYTTKILSTGMSTEAEIERAVELLNPQIIMHTNSTYPTPVEDLNMGYITHLRKKYPDKDIGFSNHYFGITPMIVSTALGVSWLEFHITEDHTLWGSDQASSVEPVGVFKLTKAINDLKLAFRSGNTDRVLYPGEEKKRESLRG
jgi:N-acetylneuraminate synthase